MGRVGRCGPGVYIPGIQEELLNMLPNEYFKEDGYDELGVFILKYYLNPKTSNMVDLGQLLQSISSKVSPTYVKTKTTELIQQGDLIVVNGKTYLTPKGLLKARAQIDMEKSGLVFFNTLLQHPIVVIMADAISTISNVTVFVHDMEVQINWQTVYQNAGALKSTALIELMAFAHNGSTINFQEFNFKTDAKNNGKTNKNKCEIADMMVSLIGKEPKLI